MPASSRNFEAKGIVAKSIEEIFGQLAGVVDTLDKSGELGTRTPEKEMLDNPAGNINFGKSIAFTFDQMVQKTVKELKPSAQYTQQLKKSEHNTLQETLGILHPLENPVSTNAYVIIQNPTTMNIGNIVTAQVNYDDTLTKIEALAQTPQLLEAPKNTAERERIINLQIIMQLFLQQHLEFWINTTDTIREFSKSASCLNEKRNPTTTSCN